MVIALGVGLAIAFSITLNYYVPFLPSCSSGQCQQAFILPGSYIFGVPLSAYGVIFWLAHSSCACVADQDGDRG